MPDRYWRRGHLVSGGHWRRGHWVNKRGSKTTTIGGGGIAALIAVLLFLGLSDQGSGEPQETPAEQLPATVAQTVTPTPTITELPKIIVP